MGDVCPLPHIAEYFSPEAQFPGLLIGHHPLGGGEDGDSVAVEHRRNLFASHINPSSWFADSLNISNHGPFCIRVFQIDPQPLVPAQFLLEVIPADVAGYKKDRDY